MHLVILIAGGLGAWLLFAGPVYQAALELREQEVDHQQFESIVKTVPAPPKLSPWWWLLPPVAYVKQRRKSRDYQASVLEALPSQAVQQWVDFTNKATGWLIVALGAFLIAIKETWELVEYLDWPALVFWGLCIVAFLLSVGNAAVRMSRSAQIAKRTQAKAG